MECNELRFNCSQRDLIESGQNFVFIIKDDVIKRCGFYCFQNHELSEDSSKLCSLEDGTEEKFIPLNELHISFFASESEAIARNELRKKYNKYWEFIKGGADAV